MDTRLFDRDRRCEVITFYSYKGGTGRTMALSNAACIYARDGDRRVLAIDWDLEAPGLHFYLRPARSAADGTSVPGIAGYFCTALDVAKGRAVVDEDEDARAEAILAEIDLAGYIRPTGLTGIDVMPAGRLDANYGDQLGGLDWRMLYELAPGIYRAFARRVAAAYDVVLVDSRTGMTDISGICTSLLPDKLVVVFTPNHQSLTGVEKLIQSSIRYRQTSPDIRPLLIYPLASRIDGQRDKLRAAWRQGDGDGVEGYQPQFERIFREAYALDHCDMSTYFENVQAPHSPDYAFGEEIAALSVGEADRLSLVRGYESLVEWLETSAAAWENPHVVQSKRLFAVRLAKEQSEAARTGSTRAVLNTYEEMLAYLRSHQGDRDPEVVDLEITLADMYSESLIDLDRYTRLLDEIASQLSALRGTYFWKSVRLLLLGSARLKDSESTRERALRWTEAVRTGLASTGASDNPSSGTVLVQIAAELCGGGSFAEARVVQQFLYDESRRVAGADDVRTLHAMNDLATTLRAMGDFAEAKRLQRLLVETASRTLGDSDGATRSFVINYAATLVPTNDLVAAEEMLKRVIAAEDRDASDAVDLQAIEARDLLATVESSKANLDASIGLRQQVLEMSRRFFGDTHERTIDAMTSFAFEYIRRDEVGLALPLLEKVVELRRAALGFTHPLTGRAMQDLRKARFAIELSTSKGALGSYRKMDPVDDIAEPVEAATPRDHIEASRK